MLTTTVSVDHEVAHTHLDDSELGLASREIVRQNPSVLLLIVSLLMGCCLPL